MAQRAQNPAPGRCEILQAATDLFAEAGYDAVSISEIAQRAGTSKANVFHHFCSKEALYLEVMRAACSGFSAASETLAGDDESHAERLVAFMRRDIALMDAQPDRTHLILREILESGPGRGQALASQVFDEHFGQLVALFREAQEAGAFAEDLPPEAAAVVVAACNTFLFQSRDVLRHLPGVDFADDPERYVRLVSRILLDGLRRELHVEHKPVETR